MSLVEQNAQLLAEIETLRQALAELRQCRQSRGVLLPTTSSSPMTVSTAAEEDWREWHAVLTRVTAGTASVAGDAYFRALVQQLAESLGVRYALVAELVGPRRDRLRSLASWANGEFGEPGEYPVAVAPCQQTIELGEYFCATQVADKYSEDAALAEMKAESYCGVRIDGPDGQALGTLCVMDDRPMEDAPQLRALLQVLAGRSALEILRAQADEKTKQSALCHQLVAELSNSITYMVTLFDGNQVSIDWTSGSIQKLTGYSSEELRHQGWQVLFSKEDLPAIHEQIRQLLSNEIHGSFEQELRVIAKDGVAHWMRNSFHTPSRTSLEEPLQLQGVLIDITQKRREEEFISAQNQILERLAKGDSLPRVLDSLVAAIEQQIPDVIASILLLEEDRLRHGAAINLPAEYIAQIDGLEIGPSVGSCGTAAYKKRRVVVSDILTDSRWDSFRELATRYEFRSCWSQPILDEHRQVLGTLALYFRQPRTPSPDAVMLMDSCSNLAGIAIQRKRAEQALHESEERYRAIFRNAPDALFVLVGEGDDLGRIVAANDRTAHMHGCEVEELIGQSIVGLYAPKAIEEVDRHFRELLAGERLTFEVDHLRRDGTRFAAEVTAECICLNGQSHILAFEHDISERILAAHRLEEINGRLDEAQAIAHVGSFYWEVDDEHALWSDEAYRIYGIEIREQVLLTDYFERIHPDHRDQVRNSIQEALEAQSGYRIEYQIVRPSGELRWVHARATCVVSPEGQTVALQGTCQDITRQKQSQRTLEETSKNQAQTVAALSQRNEEMQQLLYAVTHDLKSPLVTIQGFCGRLRKHLTDGNRQQLFDAARRIQAGTRTMARLLDDIHELGRIGRRAIEVDLLATQEFIDEALDALHSDLTKKNCRVEVLGPIPSVPADPNLLFQVLLNLLQNAIKYGCQESGSTVWIGGATLADEVRLYVRDAGPGIASKHHARIFQLFTRLQTKQEGTGVGLATVAKIMERHSGRVWVESTVGQGATFWLSFPRREVASRGAAQ